MSYVLNDHAGTECLCNFGCDDKVKLSVCGSNGKTYVNKCFLEEESCTEQVLITVANSSICDDKMGGSVDSKSIPSFSYRHQNVH